MTRYEYLTLQSFTPTRPGYFTVFQNGRTESLQANTLNDAMNRFGQEGWELVSTARSDSEGLLCLFKRVIA